MAHMNNEFETAISHFYSPEEFRKLQNSVVGIIGAGRRSVIEIGQLYVLSDNLKTSSMLVNEDEYTISHLPDS